MSMREILKGRDEAVGPIHLTTDVEASVQQSACHCKARRKRKALRFILRAALVIGVFHLFHLGRHLIGSHFHRHRDHSPLHYDLIQSSLMDTDDIEIWCPEWPKEGLPEHPPRHTLLESSLTFNLSVSADLLYLVSKGAAVGKVSIDTDESIPKDKVQINVTAQFKNPHTLDRIAACEVRSEDGNKRGVSVWHDPHHDHPRHEHHHASFHIDVKIPYEEGSVTQLKDFATALSIFPHNVGDLKDKVDFKSLSLRAANTPIEVESIKSEHIKVHTVNAPIKGQFYALDSIELESVNAPIKSHVHLYNDESKENPASLSFKTANAPIIGTVDLHRSTQSGGKYFLSVANNAGKVDLIVPTAPINSTLHLEATTSVAPVQVELPDTFEGSYKLETTFASASLEVDKDKKDPEGRGRKKIYQDSGKEGYLEWSDEDGNPSKIGRDRGEVALKTVFAPIKLRW